MFSKSGQYINGYKAKTQREGLEMRFQKQQPHTLQLKSFKFDI